MLNGLLHCRPQEARTEGVADRLLAHIEAGLDVNLTLAAARTLILHLDERKRLAAALRLHAAVALRCEESAATPYRLPARRAKRRARLRPRRPTAATAASPR